MTAKQHIFRVRRNYNQWVANQTLEDYALRFTAKSARRWSNARVATTALGAISFLALEAIGGAITLHYGFSNAVAAICAVSLIIFLTAIPISYYAAKYGVDIDLLTRGAGFGYIGSTITSLIYASFTFIFFALEAAIMAMALELLFDIPLAWGYLISSVVIIPLVTHGITFISRFQLWTQPFWVLLQLIPFVFIIYADASSVENWTEFAGSDNQHQGLNILFFGAASAVVFSLIAQIGEQVDFLRFLPTPKPGQRWRWWAALIAGGPGWIVIGTIKILAGSFLAVLAVNHGITGEDAADPTRMYMVAFSYIASSPEVALCVAGIFVIISQLKINVTNAYAGSIAWSNFFSRLTHSHPGRVVWLVFNVAIALLLMELGVYRALEQTLGYYGIVAVAWLGALVADLVINKPLGLSPRHIEFKRAHLYDINPAGVGAMLIASVLGILFHSGICGAIAQALSHFLTLAAALTAAPCIAWATKSRYYLARPLVVDTSDLESLQGTVTCCICEHRFEREDMTHCPAYAGHICSLCCSLDARCQDYCKPGANYSQQLALMFKRFLPQHFSANINSRLGHFIILVLVINGLSAILLSLIYFQTPIDAPETAALLEATLWKVFFLLVIITGVVSWLFVLAHESRVVAQEESQRQTRLLMEEIEAHERTDRALQIAKEQAEAANLAKSRYLTGISHELRSPLNAVLGYAQLLEMDPSMPAHRREALGVIRRSGEHLADLIEGLLDISKIEAGRLDLHQDQVRINVLIEQLVHMFRLQAQAKGLDFIFECRDKLPELVKTDEKRLRQILINLLSNAIKYTAQGSITFKVRYRSQVAEFTLIDTGEGIAPENIERIFHPFERVRHPNSTTTGTGLGLTITRLLSDIMGGDIAVTSTPGKGSTFKATLMLARIDHRIPALDIPPVQTIYGYQGPVRRLLLVDDEDSHRQLIRAMLLPLGFDIIDLRNPLLAIEQLHTSQTAGSAPDLLMLDVSMPGLSGWELAQQVRDAGFKQPIIMVSADASEGKNLHWNNSKENTLLHQAYIIKPVRLNLLLDHIGKLLQLEWRYEKAVLSAASTPATDPVLIHLPAEEHLDDIARLASIGHKKGLLDKIHQLRSTQAASDDFIDSLQKLTNHFQFDKILELVNTDSLEDAEQEP
ncbi:hybrid sensor histidine kinase/response regulator [Cellvibrio japonicus]|uniref:histidine kinase n=1 Tax=Cellvibrio japonicus (strain Ueda107) TaxID=498211 RepID=B3PLD0_CELJU|nr:ATP-binding protein [Cellvibrio japonicus]ACE83288.1 two-component hybrid sensor and regulator [Cellvibrio japonicus Ueda107]QEI11582.1 response regulator [Cellvibrio japonicus]QEI15156.1 response regulator [Cellvibrio japonicus]QEI18736.1 response regulator [Cellvibrio japonicus]